MKSPGILIGSWFVAGAALTLAGCSDSSSETKPDEAAPSPAVTQGPADCATGADLAGRLSDPRITQVQIVGDCHSVAISTGLADDEADLALLVCDSAAELAYADAAITGVQVTGEAGTELATGARDKPCAAA
ncbi:hypothetical protein LWF15_26680 [Kineosporia rhizophila]|uniref:hypothetical protein n=1 Tax=Kineosporia TaxID=49184 RepID=UPI001E290167|nr:MULTISPECIES: hypothetical protein [Kineosporia]MCE0539091.1 hypothetical protein [Kineosporia rhizophila]GLY17807.1 hypothetical protein Kisp01_48210 [Kineosporia sp. NBRC 101677]